MNPSTVEGIRRGRLQLAHGGSLLLRYQISSATQQNDSPSWKLSPSPGPSRCCGRAWRAHGRRGAPLPRRSRCSRRSNLTGIAPLDVSSLLRGQHRHGLQALSCSAGAHCGEWTLSILPERPGLESSPPRPFHGQEHYCRHRSSANSTGQSWTRFAGTNAFMRV